MWPLQRHYTEHPHNMRLGKTCIDMKCMKCVNTIESSKNTVRRRMFWPIETKKSLRTHGGIYRTGICRLCPRSQNELLKVVAANKSVVLFRSAVPVVRR